MSITRLVALLSLLLCACPSSEPYCDEDFAPRCDVGRLECVGTSGRDYTAYCGRNADDELEVNCTAPGPVGSMTADISAVAKCIDTDGG